LGEGAKLLPSSRNLVVASVVRCSGEEIYRFEASPATTLFPSWVEIALASCKLTSTYLLTYLLTI